MVAEITDIFSQGFWLSMEEGEHFMSYENFPWFKDQPLKAVIHVDQPAPGYLYWPDIDVDL